MDAPYVLLTSPRPLDSAHGRVQSSAVFSLRGSRKRKREELVLGIDGEAVNVYEISKQSIQTSYAIPPTAYLCCAPLSVHIQTETSTERDTYVVLRSGPDDKKRRLVRFQERSTNEAEFAAPAKTECALPQGDVYSINALPSTSLSATLAPCLLVTYTDGEVLCVTEDLSQVMWQTSIRNESDRGRVEACFVEEASTVRQGVLQSREDISILLQPSAQREPVAVCFVVKDSASTLLRICSIDPGAPQRNLQQLGDIRLSDSASSTVSTWELSADSGLLCQLTNGMLQVYDLKGIVPRISLSISEKSARHSSMSLISRSLLLAASPSRMILYDMQYGSIQGSVMLPNSAAAVGRKRKREDETETPDITLHWFPGITTAVVASATVIGVPLTPELASHTSKPVRLASVVGKSAADQSSADTSEHADATGREQWRQQVENLIANKDMTGLEHAVAVEFGIDIGLPATVEAIGDAQFEEMLWDLESAPINLSSNQRPRAYDVLQRMFAVDASGTTTPLQLRSASRNLVRWLFSAELLSSPRLSGMFGGNYDIKHVAQALAAADPTFLLLHDVLTLSVHLPIDFLVECLRLLIRSLDTTTKINGTASATDLDDEELDNEAQAAEAELSNAVLTLQSGLEIRSATIQLLFGRLHAFAKKTLTRALRAGLELRDLVFFVHLLRIELAEAGWTRSYVGQHDEPTSSPGADEEEITPSNGAIRTIGNLMIAAVDAIGPAGWLIGLTTDEDEQSGLVDALRAEIGASLEGVYEAQLLKSTLDDFERFALLRQDSTKQTQSRPRIEVQAATESNTAMPMGGRSSVLASQATAQSRKGAKLPQSVLRAKQKDEMVGAYQFERIRV